MSIVELRLCRRPPRELWLKPELPKGADGAIIGWIQDIPAVEGGVPRAVSRVITKALTKSYRLTFVDPGHAELLGWQDHGDRAIRFLHAEGIGRLNPTAGYTCTSTVSPELALRLFETDESLWALQSQVVLFTDREASPPNVSFGTIDALMRARRLDPVGLQQFGCVGVMTPGPDGDFAQLVFWQTEAMERFQQGVRVAAKNAGLSFAEASESEFRQTKWFLEEVGT